jgi:spoIIIJ-associated protein
MRTIEITGKTIEEAKELASAELGVPIDQIEFETVDEGGKGFLGLSRNLARVKATADVEPIEEPEGEPVAEHPAAQRTLGDQTESEWVLSMVQQTLAAAKLDASAALKSEAGGDIGIEISGPDVAILIGKHGQTLDALQYLLTVALSRVSDKRTRVNLDAEGYRDRYAELLTAKALEYARRVKESGEEAVLDPQSPRDRRLVHVALAEDPDVYTYSEGDGDYRHVVISPRK